MTDIPEVKAGAQRVNLNLEAWYDPSSGDIHLALPQSDWFRTTVNKSRGSKRCHRNLYSKLSQALKEAGAPSPKKDGKDGKDD